jgi:hypothetical protein
MFPEAKRWATFAACLALAACRKGGDEGAERKDAGIAPVPSSEHKADAAAPLAAPRSWKCGDGPPAPADAPAPTPLPGARAKRLGNMLRLEPMGIEIKLDERFVGWSSEVLTERKALERVRGAAGEWNTIYSPIAAAALPFEACIAHVGEEEWLGNGVFSDMTYRIYVFREPVEDVRRAILARSVREAEQIGCQPPHRGAAARWTEPGASETGWERIDVTVDVWYSDYGGLAHVDVRAKRFGEATVAVAFLYEGGSPDLEKPWWAVDVVMRGIRDTKAGAGP